jgi:hypothetical protein
MPYDVNADLPPSVRSHLPEHAQDIFREAFNLTPTPLTRMIPGRRRPLFASPGRRSNAPTRRSATSGWRRDSAGHATLALLVPRRMKKAARRRPFPILFLRALRRAASFH